MLPYLDNRHAEPLQGLIRHLQGEPNLSQDEVDALAALSREIERETTTATYRLWLKEKQTKERLTLGHSRV